MLQASVAAPVKAPSSSIEFLGHQFNNLPIPVDGESVRSSRCYVRTIDEFDGEHNLGEGWAETKKQYVPLVDMHEKCTNEL